MPNIVANKKHLRKSIKREKRNRAIKSRIKTIYNGILQLLSTKDSSKASEVNGKLSFFYKVADKAVLRGVFKKNTIARKKSKLAKKVLNLKNN